jgi:hypothetical protein
MSNNIKLVLVIALLVGGIWGGQIIEFVKNNIPAVVVDDTNNTAIPKPNIAYQTLVEPLRQMEIDKKDAVEIRDFFWQLSQMIQHEPGFIKTTAQFREFNMVAGGLNFAGLEMKNKYPDLGEAIDSIIMDSIGKQNVPLDDDKRAKLYKTLHAIAWSVQ